jgi:hypothetical protein
MARAHHCDVPGCTRLRKRWQRLCELCFAALPGDIRTGIIGAHQAGRKADWRRERRRAAEHLTNTPAPLVRCPAVTTVCPCCAGTWFKDFAGFRMDLCDCRGGANGTLKEPQATIIAHSVAGAKADR